MLIWCILVIPAPNFDGGTTEVLLAGKFPLCCNFLRKPLRQIQFFFKLHFPDIGCSRAESPIDLILVMAAFLYFRHRRSGLNMNACIEVLCSSCYCIYHTTSTLY